MKDNLKPTLFVDWDFDIVDDMAHYRVFLKLENEILMTRTFAIKASQTLSNPAKEKAIELCNKIQGALET